ncbi:MAG: hypothetical protein ACREM8_13140 [Vulcanimicrobiaceae bacterium]
MNKIHPEHVARALVAFVFCGMLGIVATLTYLAPPAPMNPVASIALFAPQANR